MIIQQLFRTRIAKAMVVGCCLASVIGLWPQSAIANQSFQRESRFQLAAIAAQFSLNNPLTSYSAQLSGGRSEAIRLPALSADQTYVLIGLCDSHCYDLDFSVYDEHDNLVTRNIADHAYPMVHVSPKWTGDFTLHISMPSCVVNMCSYRVGVFNQRRPSRR